MSKHVSQERLALYVGGDLSAREATAVGDHLNCEDCRTALAGFEQARNLLTSSYQDPEPGDLFEVRQRVISQLPTAEGTKRWIWALAGAAVMATALVIALLPVRQAPQRIDPTQAVAQLPLPGILPAPRLTEIPSLNRVAAQRQQTSSAGLRSVALITRADEPTLIKMTTADPNVLILWQANTKEEKE